MGTLTGTLSTHVLDTSLGRPADGIRVALHTREGEQLGHGVTDADGRIATIGPNRLPAGDYRLVFETADYFVTGGRSAFYPEVVVVFTITDAEQHYHVPLLLNPYGFSTYRGS